jgi:hypothetical protein
MGALRHTFFYFTVERRARSTQAFLFSQCRTLGYCLPEECVRLKAVDIDSCQPENTVTDDTPIWRYMDFPKFVSMLSTRHLWFTKAAKYEDPYEGFCEAVPCAGSGQEWQGTVSDLIGRFARDAAEECRNAREHLYVNSWCLEFESMAMWEIYGSRGCGVAVESSVGQYRAAADFPLRPEEYGFGQVEYHRDLKSSGKIKRDFTNGLVPVGPGLWPKVIRLGFNKTAAFAHEKEWRGVLRQPLRPTDEGVGIPFDLEKLISAVYVGPRAEGFFFEAVASVVEKFLRGEVPLKRSVLLDPLPKEITASAD